jgi:ABC-type transporter Mla MlaB component
MGANLCLVGEQNIRNVTQTAAQLCEQLNGDGPLVIDCSRATDIDVAFVQLLLAARKSAGEQGRVLRLHAAASGALLACLRAGGFLPEAPGAVRGTYDFWMAMESQ